MIEQSQSSKGSKFFHGGDVLMKISKIPKFAKIKEKMEMKRGRKASCSTSDPSGNQVDGLPLVAIPKQ